MFFSESSSIAVKTARQEMMLRHHGHLLSWYEPQRWRTVLRCWNWTSKRHLEANRKKRKRQQSNEHLVHRVLPTILITYINIYLIMTLWGGMKCRFEIQTSELVDLLILPNLKLRRCGRDCGTALGLWTCADVLPKALHTSAGTGLGGDKMVTGWWMVVQTPDRPGWFGARRRSTTLQWSMLCFRTLGVGCYTLGFFLGSGFICCNLFLLVRCCTEPICDSNIPAEVMVPHSPRSVTSRCSLTTVSPRSVRHGSFPWRNSLTFFLYIDIACEGPLLYFILHVHSIHIDLYIYIYIYTYATKLLIWRIGIDNMLHSLF